MVRKVLQLIVLSLLLAACGTVATPAAQESIQETRIAEAATAAQQTADAPTLPPTETPEPTATVAPTETPEPTATDEATEEATEEVTEEATEETGAVDTESTDESDEIVGDAEAGQELFNQFIAEVNFACSTCHLPNSEQQLIGPGLLNIGTRAAERVEGQTANEYLHTSIVDPSAHVVEGFPDMLMPQTYEEILSQEDIDNLVAYLFTLTD